LNPGPGQLSAIYDRLDRLPEIRAALTASSDYVEALVNEKYEQEQQAEPKPEEVVA
jgi:hypothetical protein